MVTPGSAELVNVDELVSISMHETAVVVRPMRRPDALGTQVLVDVVNAANVAGSAVVLHRPGGLVDSDVAIDVPAASDDVATECVAAGVGLVEVRSERLVWTIDYGSARFVRSDRPVESRFLAASDWTAFEEVWIGPQFLRVRTVDGSYVAGRRALRKPSGQRSRDDRVPTRTLHDMRRPVSSSVRRQDPYVAHLMDATGQQ